MKERKKKIEINPELYANMIEKRAYSKEEIEKLYKNLKI